MTGADDRPGGLRGSVTAAADLFDADTVQAFAVRLGACWLRWPPSPQVRLHQVTVLDSAERAQLLAEWNDTAVPVPEASVPELVSARAARIPDAVAVVCGECACQLRGAGCAGGAAGGAAGRAGCGSGVGGGVVPGSRRRSGYRDRGVWRAGAAYVPVDPGYPAGPAGVYAGRQRRWGAGRPAAGRPMTRAWVRSGGGLWLDAAAGRRWSPVSAAGAVRGGAAGVCDLYVGVDRGPKGVAVTHGGW